MYIRTLIRYNIWTFLIFSLFLSYYHRTKNFCKKIKNTITIKIVNIEIIKTVIDFYWVNYLFKKKKMIETIRSILWWQLDCLGFIRLVERIKIENQVNPLPLPSARRIHLKFNAKNYRLKCFWRENSFSVRLLR